MTKNISIVSVLKTYRRINGFPKWLYHRNESSKGTVPCNAPQQIRFLKLIPSYKKAIDSFIDSEVKKSKSFIYSQHALNFYTSKFPVCYSSFLHYPNPRSSPYFSYIVINTSLTEAIIQCDYGFWGETDALQKKNGKWGPAAGNTISIHSIE